MRIEASVIMLAACGRVGFEPGVIDANADAVTYGPWSPATPIGELNTPMDESDPDLRGDALEIVFHSKRTGGQGLYDLYRATRAATSDLFSPAVPITSVNTAADEIGPSLSADGRTLYFSDGADIVFATRPDLATPFGAAQLLAALSSADVDTAPEVSGDGRIAVITRGITDARELWLYTRASDGAPNAGWSGGVQLGELGSAAAESSADLDASGLSIYFHSNRLGTTDDIYVAGRASTDVPFEAPQIVDVISTAGDEGDPSRSADQRILVFHRMLDLFAATR